MSVDIKKMLSEVLEQGHFIEAVLSNVRKKSLETFSKVTLRPLLLKGDYVLQLTYQYDKKVLHENLTPAEAIEVLGRLQAGYFKQGQYYTNRGDYQVLVSKSGEAKVLKQKATKALKSMAHNVVKQYVLEEGKPVDFLIALGIMSSEGNVHKSKYPKFRQINKYLEILEDAIARLEVKGPVKVVDFGCGKAYLTFAMYYYFVNILKQPVDIVGLDLKADVISDLRQLCERLGYVGLRFEQGDIEHFEWDQRPDIVVSLHACDTATDAAIAKAIEWQAQVILAVPCCQHEAFDQIENTSQSVLLKHGILKERFAALATDAIRASVMALHGYQTVVMEFVDMEHTPKNLMLRGRFDGPLDPAKKLELEVQLKAYVQFWHLSPALFKLLSQI